MNFDQLKDEWNKDEVTSNHVSENMLKMKQAHTPIDQIRKKMKHEFFWQILSLIIMAFAPKILRFSQELDQVYMIFFAIVCGFTAYYFFKFYTFYKHSYNLSLDSRKNLLWFYYEMKLNTELYKAHTYIVAFIYLSFISVALFLINGNVILKLLEKVPFMYIAINAAATILVIGIVTELWAKLSYGKHLKRLKLILDSIDEE